MNWQTIFIKPSKTPDRNKYYFGLAAVLVFCAGSILSLIQPGTISTDGGIFTAIALKDLHGGTLYIDAWENKAPGIFYLIKVFIFLVPNPINAIFTLVFLSLLMTAFCLYTLAFKWLKSLSLALSISLIAVYFTLNETNLGDGLYTEIYGTLCILLSLIFFTYIPPADRRNIFIISAGFFAGLGFWFKEPFILLALPLLGIQTIHLKTSRDRYLLMFSFVLPTVLFLITLLVNGSFQGFYDMLLFNFKYLHAEESVPWRTRFNQMDSGLIQPAFGIFILLFYMVYAGLRDKKTILYSLFSILIIVAASHFIFLSPYNFGHYYYPLFTLSMPFVAYQYKLFQQSRKSTLKWPLLILCLFTIYKIDQTRPPRLKYQIDVYKPDKIVAFLKKEKGKTLFVDCVEKGDYYIKTGLLYPTFLPIALPVHFNETEAGKKNRVRIWNTIKNESPDYLITAENTSYYSWFFPEPDFYIKNYTKIDSVNAEHQKTLFLWQKVAH